MNKKSISSAPVNTPVRGSESRKVRKPLMEKKRRARINDSLNSLKRILMESNSLNKKGDRPTKIEKADILELTVSHLQKIKAQHSTQQTAEERLGFPSMLSGIDQSAHMFKAGFSECSRLMDNMLHNIIEKNTHVGMQQRLRQHLTNCLATLPQVSSPYLERSSSSHSDSSSTSSSSSLVLLSPVSHVDSSSLLSPVSSNEHSPASNSELHYSCQSSPENCNMLNCENTIPSSTILSSPVSSSSKRSPLSFHKNMFINPKTSCLNDPKMWRPW